MAVEFKPAPFKDYDASSNQCLIGGIQQQDDGEGNMQWCSSLGTLPPHPNVAGKGLCCARLGVGEGRPPHQLRGMARVCWSF
jgi:hypothetical protein